MNKWQSQKCSRSAFQKPQFQEYFLRIGWAQLALQFSGWKPVINCQRIIPGSALWPSEVGWKSHLVCVTSCVWVGCLYKVSPIDALLWVRDGCMGDRTEPLNACRVRRERRGIRDAGRSSTKGRRDWQCHYQQWLQHAAEHLRLCTYVCKDTMGKKVSFPFQKALRRMTGGLHTLRFQSIGVGEQRSLQILLMVKVTALYLILCYIFQSLFACYGTKYNIVKTSKYSWNVCSPKPAEQPPYSGYQRFL